MMREPSGTAVVEEALSQRSRARRTAHALATHVVFPGPDRSLPEKLALHFVGSFATTVCSMSPNTHSG